MRISFEADERPVLVKKLGLKENVSDADITAAFEVWATKEEDEEQQQQGEEEQQEGQGSVPGPVVTPPTGPVVTPPQPSENAEDDDDDDDEAEGSVSGSTVTLDIEAFNSLTKRAARAAKIEEDARIQTRNSLIEACIKAGKFGPGRREHYTARYDSDPEGTTKVLGRMAKNVVPVEERGHDVADEVEDQTAYPTDWLPEVKAATTIVTTPNGNGNPARRNRVMSED